MSGAEIAKSSRWGSPSPMKSTPTLSASTASSTTSRRTCACGVRLPSGARVTSPNVSRPSSTSCIDDDPVFQKGQSDDSQTQGRPLPSLLAQEEPEDRQAPEPG